MNRTELSYSPHTHHLSFFPFPFRMCAWCVEWSCDITRLGVFFVWEIVWGMRDHGDNVSLWAALKRNFKKP